MFLIINFFFLGKINTQALITMLTAKGDDEEEGAAE